jgi:hypothetical protein
MMAAMQLAPQPSFMTRWFAAPPRPRVTRWSWQQVRHGATRLVTPPPGRVTVHCRGGEAWITQDGDPKDVFLRPDESYTTERRDCMALHALRGDCVFEIQVDD